MLCPKTDKHDVALSMLGRDHGCFFGEMFLADEPTASEDILVCITDDCFVSFIVLAGTDSECEAGSEKNQSLGRHSIC